MRRIVLIVAASLAGCAGTPSAPTAVSAAAKPAPAAPVEAHGAGAQVGAPPGGVTPELYAKARQQGYRAKVIKGHTIFCRDEAPIGSRITKEACVSPDELENSIRQAEVVRDQMSRGQTCGKDACGGQ